MFEYYSRFNECIYHVMKYEWIGIKTICGYYPLHKDYHFLLSPS